MQTSADDQVGPMNEVWQPDATEGQPRPSTLGAIIPGSPTSPAGPTLDSFPPLRVKEQQLLH